MGRPPSIGASCHAALSNSSGSSMQWQAPNRGQRDQSAVRGTDIAMIMSATTAIISSRSTATVCRCTVCQALSSSPITATPMTSAEWAPLPAIACPSLHDARVTMRLRDFRKSSSSGAECAEASTNAPWRSM